MKKTIFATIAMILLAATVLVTSYGQSASAQIVKKDNGASSLAPGVESLKCTPSCVPLFAPQAEPDGPPVDPAAGWMPQEIPGIDGLKAEIIGPKK